MDDHQDDPAHNYPAEYYKTGSWATFFMVLGFFVLPASLIISALAGVG